MKYIFVTGGVVSGLGKGICAASLGRLLKQCGLKVKNQKFDPYLNVDPGTMSPYQHGEVFVTDDGAETDLDLGHYERFVDEALDEKSSVSSGKIFWSVLNRERQGGYLGGTVQIIPHVTDEIKRRIYDMDDGETDVAISEIGGTVGDIESQPFLEAIRQVAAERERENVLFIHVPLIVTIPGSGELKSKPTQHSVKELLSEGIQPDVLVVRTDEPITDDIRRKIALFCNVEPDCVIQNATASTLYEVPLLLEHEGLCRVVCRKLHLDCGEPDMTEWRALDVEEDWACEARRYYIGIVGKFGAQVQTVLKKAAALDIQTICPLHGPVLTENLGYYINLYNIWSSYAVESEGVMIAYTSVYGNTKKAVEYLAEELKAKGCPKVVVCDLPREDMAEAVEDAFRYGKLVLATTTYNGDIFPFMRTFIDHLTERNFQNRKIALVENGSWAPVAAKVMAKALEGSKNIELAGTVTIRGALKEENKRQLAELAAGLMQ